MAGAHHSNQIRERINDSRKGILAKDTQAFRNDRVDNIKPVQAVKRVRNYE
jgi:hypothetical protein